MFCVSPLLHRTQHRLFAVLWLCALVLPIFAAAQPGQMPSEREVTLEAKFWVDDLGNTGIEQVSAAPERFQALTTHRSFQLAKKSALWLRLDLLASSSKGRSFLQLSSGTFFDRANLYQRLPTGSWLEQKAGDHLPVASWDHPDQTPVFQVDLSVASTVWLRLENQPASIAPRLQLIGEETLAAKRRWAALLLGGYFGFGLLVLFLGIIHVRLYGDRAFIAYSAYVAFMLLFQLAFTGIGGLYFWPNWAAWGNAAPALFMLLLTASGIWFVREASVLARHSKTIDGMVMAWVSFGVLFAFAYTLAPTRASFLLLNVYGLLSVLLSIGLCLWVWRRGERYGAWLFLGFLPVHLGYPFPALRSAGLIADSWLSQYAVLIGSAIEIPLLLYVLHMRAKEFSENRARVRAIDQTDALTGLAITPVLTLRARDALRRNRRRKQVHALLLVELANHAELLNTAGRPLADRALVVAASCLQSAINDLDTVCRINDSHFAILIESSADASITRLVAQRIVARGLAEQSKTLENQPLRFRVVTCPLINAAQDNDLGRDVKLNELLDPLFAGMRELDKEPKKAIFHLHTLPVPDTTSVPPTQPAA
jgi:two-component system, sensor histidine kinase LadS